MFHEVSDDIFPISKTIMQRKSDKFQIILTGPALSIDMFPILNAK